MAAARVVALLVLVVVVVVVLVAAAVVVEGPAWKRVGARVAQLVWGVVGVRMAVAAVFVVLFGHRYGRDCGRERAEPSKPRLAKRSRTLRR